MKMVLIYKKQSFSISKLSENLSHDIYAQVSFFPQKNSVHYITKKHVIDANNTKLEVA